MSVYGVHKFLRSCLHDTAFRSRALEDPEAALAQMPLDEAEKRALREGDIAWLYEHGVHAFLLSYLTRWTLFGVSVPIYSERIQQAKDWRQAS
jgi:hypothetical protein